MPDVKKLKFAYTLHSILKPTEEACLKTLFFAISPFLG